MILITLDQKLSLKLENVSPPTRFLLSQGCFGYSSSFYIHFRLSLSTYTKAYWNFCKVSVNLR